MEYIQSISGVIGGIILALITAYVTTKGKYWADSESLPKLTVEIEQIKSGLSVLTNKQNVLFHEEKEAMYHFFSSYTKWYGMIDRFALYNYNHRNYKDLDEHLEKTFDEVFNTDVQLGLARMALFVSNEDIYEEALILCDKTDDLKEVVLGIGDKLYDILDDEADFLKDTNITFENIYEEFAVLHTKFPDHRQKKKELAVLLQSTINPIDLEVQNLLESFKKKCRNTLFVNRG